MTIIPNAVVPGAGQFVPGQEGVTDGSAPAPNTVGEYFETAFPFVSAVSLTTQQTKNVFTIELPAGDWDVEGNVNISYTSATSTDRSAGLTSTSATIPSDGTGVNSAVQFTTTTIVDGITIPRKRFSLTQTTTIYMVVRTTFTAGSAAAYGAITARRVR